MLLKNEGHLLPLSKEIASIAVIGPNADDVQVLLGNYRGTPSRVITPLEGIRNKISSTTKLYAARGCELAAGMDPLTVIPSACLRPANADGYQTGLAAVYFDNPEFEREPASRNCERNEAISCLRRVSNGGDCHREYSTASTTASTRGGARGRRGGASSLCSSQ